MFGDRLRGLEPEDTPARVGPKTKGNWGERRRGTVHPLGSGRKRDGDGSLTVGPVAGPVWFPTFPKPLVTGTLPLPCTGPPLSSSTQSLRVSGPTVVRLQSRFMSPRRRIPCRESRYAPRHIPDTQVGFLGHPCGLSQTHWSCPLLPADTRLSHTPLALSVRGPPLPVRSVVSTGPDPCSRLDRTTTGPCLPGS